MKMTFTFGTLVGFNVKHTVFDFLFMVCDFTSAAWAFNNQKIFSHYGSSMVECSFVI